MGATYFDAVRHKLNRNTLRTCQTEAFAARSKNCGTQGQNAACIMSVGAGKAAPGGTACLAFARKRALVITPGSVMRGTFDKALDHQVVGNVLYGLSGGPLVPGCKPPHVLTLDCDGGSIRAVTSGKLREADVIITNFHSLGTGEDQV